MQSVTIIGVGRLGGAFAIALSRSGYTIERLVYRDRVPEPRLAAAAGMPELVPFDRAAQIMSHIVIFAVSDQDLENAANLASETISSSSAVLHTSGALSSEMLAAAAKRGCPTASMHPLISVSDPFVGAGSFSGAFFCVEGSEDGAVHAASIVSALGGTPFTIGTGSKPLYHAAAVMASGHLVSLLAAAIEMLESCGLEPEKAKEVLLPLVASAVENLSAQDPSKALTGPFARTDADAVQRHLHALEDAGLQVERSVYLALGLEALKLAEINGADAGQISRIRELIKFAQGTAKC